MTATSLANWGLELGFCRTRVGREYDVIPRIQRSTGDGAAHFLAAYGYFDLVALTVVHALSEPSFVPIDEDILEFASFRFFAPVGEPAPSPILNALDRYPAAILSFLKIHPAVLRDDPTGVRWRLAVGLKQRFQDCAVLFGLGYSELLLLAAGNDLRELLGTVTESRAIEDLPAIPPPALTLDPSSSLFKKTTTVPLTSFPNVHARGGQDSLKGELHPVVTLTCDPAVEDEILSRLPKDAKARTVYGKSDLILYWPNPIPVSEFARALTSLRSCETTSGLVTKTTSYLEVERHKRERGGRPARLREADTVSSVGISTAALGALRPSALRASISDLALRLQSYVQDPERGRPFRDMVNILEYVMEIVAKVMVDPDRSDLEKMRARFELNRVADLARTAINQRYAGLENHPETLAHATAPTTCDIATIVQAATCVPHFLFDRLRSDKSAEEVWSGFVVFGTVAPHWHPGHILALPADSLYAPINEWWKITHEVGHAAFRLLGITQRLREFSPRLYKELVDDDGPARESPEHIIGEVFANWFDWQYVFERDTGFYLRQIWGSWLGYPLIWTSPMQYLCRSFAVFLCEDIDAWRASKLRGRRDKHLFPFLQQKWNQFAAVIDGTPHWREFLEQSGTETVDRVIRVMEVFLPLMMFYTLALERRCGLEGLSKRMHAPYPRLQADIDTLDRGIVVTEVIDNPCRLSLALLRKYGGREAALSTQIAYLLSLANTYRIVTEDRRA